MRLISLFFLITITCLSALETITIDPSQQTGAKVEYFGWDLKEWKNNATPIRKAEALYGENPANIVRVPILGLAHKKNGSIDKELYGPMLESIKNIKSTNSDVKIFASIKLKKEKTFPKWIDSAENGIIFKVPVKRPTPKKYAKIVADYIEWLRKHRIAIDFLGLNNEVSDALTPELYIETATLLMEELKQRRVPEKYSSFKFVAGEGFGIPISVKYVKKIKEKQALQYADIFGSHFYPDLNSGAIKDWDTLAAIDPSRPTWHTEIHMRSSDQPTKNINKVRNALALLFKTNQSGSQGYIWWAGTPDETLFSNLIRSKMIISLLNGSCIQTSGEYLAKDNKAGKEIAQATRVDDTVWLWYFNPNSKKDKITVNLTSGRIKKISGEYWTGGKKVTKKTHKKLKIKYSSGDDFIIQDLPSASIGLVKIELKK